MAPCIALEPGQVQDAPVRTGPRNRRGGVGDPEGGGFDRKRLIEDVFHQVGKAAALSDDDGLQFPPERVAGQDAEVAADVGDDGADRLAADLGGDLLRGGQACEAGVASSAAGAAACRGARGVAGDEAPRGAASRRSALRRSLASSALARCRPRGMRARICAISAVPKQDMTEPGSVKARRRIVAASSLP